jgi:hypothetical protein
MAPAGYLAAGAIRGRGTRPGSGTGPGQVTPWRTVVRAATRARTAASPACTHISRAMTQLGARDRTQLVVLAYETGLVRPGWS